MLKKSPGVKPGLFFALRRSYSKIKGSLRKVAIYLSCKYTGKTLNETCLRAYSLRQIGNFYGKIGDTGISQLYIMLCQLNVVAKLAWLELNLSLE
jgi:hypothetical protein